MYSNFSTAFFPPDYPGCTRMDGGISGSGFPNPSYNGYFHLSKKGSDLVLYNYHAVFEKGDYCIWFANDRYWHMGNCNNLGENSAYILKEQNKECPNNFIKEFNGFGKNFEVVEKFTGSWFSGDTNLGKSGKTLQFQPPKPEVADGNNTPHNSPTAAVTYQVRDGRYFQKCRWKKSPGGNWRCVPRHNQGMIWLRKLKYMEAFTFNYLLLYYYRHCYFLANQSIKELIVYFQC